MIEALRCPSSLDPASVQVAPARFTACSSVQCVPCSWRWMTVCLAVRYTLLTFQDMHVADARHRAYHFVKVHRLHAPNSRAFRACLRCGQSSFADKILFS